MVLVRDLNLKLFHWKRQERKPSPTAWKGPWSTTNKIIYSTMFGSQWRSILLILILFCWDVLEMPWETASWIKNTCYQSTKSPNRLVDKLPAGTEKELTVADSPSLHMEPTPPIDPAQTKRSHGEPAVEKARFCSLSSTTDTRRTPLEPSVLHPNHGRSEVHTPDIPRPESENKGAGSR